MGMAAGQARLLSITSRMSDNELRAQIINNNKMRLATESSQVSETYLAALNEAQFMFTNYQADNNVSYKPLTFNALTAYSPYNNQYALVNSANQVLISEKDAANYEHSKDLAEFLKCYGLEEDTTYFDILPTDQFDANGNYDDSGFVTYTYYAEDGNAFTVSTGFTREALKAAYFGDEDVNINMLPTGKTVNAQDCGYDNVLNGVDMYKYVTALSVYTQAKEDYEKLIDDIMLNKLDGIVKKSTGGQFNSIDTLIKHLQTASFDDASINSFYNNYLYPLVATDMTNKFASQGYGDARPVNANAPAGYVSDTYKLATPAGKEYLYDLEDKLSIPSCHCSQYHNLMPDGTSTINERHDLSTSNIEINNAKEIKVVKTNADGSPMTDGNGGYVTETRKIIDSNTTFSYTFQPGGLNTDIKVTWNSNGHLTGITARDSEGNAESITGPTAAILAALNDETGYSRYEMTEKWPDKEGNEVTRKTGIEFGDIKFNTNNETERVKVLNDDGSITEQTIPKSIEPKDLFELYNKEKGTIMRAWTTAPDTVEQKVADAINLLNNLKGSLPMIWDQTDPEFASSELDTTNTFQAYIDAANELYEIIYGQKIDYKTNQAGPPAIDALDDITTLYNEQGHSGMPVFCDSMRPVFMNLVLDNVMDTYGEPKITWINKDDPNDNSEKRTQWYTNLYNRIQASGYHVLKDGLAASPEWIKFAFESGIVTMEQVDSYNAWNQLIYTNCSDITEQTDDKAITIAEAEYNAAMNKIENKDKRYDLELKNIDTEHNSLQTEYDSIKAAIDKNIERNFKYLS